MYAVNPSRNWLHGYFDRELIPLSLGFNCYQELNACFKTIKNSKRKKYLNKIKPVIVYLT